MTLCRKMSNPIRLPEVTLSTIKYLNAKIRVAESDHLNVGTILVPNSNVRKMTDTEIDKVLENCTNLQFDHKSDADIGKEHLNKQSSDCLRNFVQQFDLSKFNQKEISQVPDNQKRTSSRSEEKFKNFEHENDIDDKTLDASELRLKFLNDFTQRYIVRKTNENQSNTKSFYPITQQPEYKESTTTVNADQKDLQPKEDADELHISLESSSESVELLNYVAQDLAQENRKSKTQTENLQDFEIGNVRIFSSISAISDTSIKEKCSPTKNIQENNKTIVGEFLADSATKTEIKSTELKTFYEETLTEEYGRKETEWKRWLEIEKDDENKTGENTLSDFERVVKTKVDSMPPEYSTKSLKKTSKYAIHGTDVVQTQDIKMVKSNDKRTYRKTEKRKKNFRKSMLPIFFSKLTQFQQEIICTIGKIRKQYENSIFCNQLRRNRLKMMIVPDSDEGRKKSEIIANEFSTRFTRNYLYQINRTIDEIIFVTNEKGYSRDNLDYLIKVCGLFGLLQQALCTYSKQVKYFIYDEQPKKLGSLIDCIIEATNICVENKIFRENDEIIKEIRKDITLKDNRFSMYNNISNELYGQDQILQNKLNKSEDLGQPTSKQIGMGKTEEMSIEKQETPEKKIALKKSTELANSEPKENLSTKSERDDSIGTSKQKDTAQNSKDQILKQLFENFHVIIEKEVKQVLNPIVRQLNLFAKDPVSF
ncbi:uncharacterized protein LOC129618974 [Condylostylus longicornis]|uniref:uncharacterized protein LOC129618974 n=1 Tax=Condylostylus longicornis TaxID=2530218 RepID=UPI00244DC1DB|nr:uncharacterized protein LOC129618974 [Condylostylus longicornis]